LQAGTIGILFQLTSLMMLHWLLNCGQMHAPPCVVCKNPHFIAGRITQEGKGFGFDDG
jgi:hypothetical protein